ncbi:MAG TPA: VanZ family protein [bacterium]|nr:VanZ family protein [bacterium]HQO35044.1 VanZ family protein [bacterium]HQP98767.1 VanZ family protein [bacterium]
MVAANSRDAENGPPVPTLDWLRGWRLAVVGIYYVLCLVLPTTVSSWISKWIGQHGWVPFNRYLRIVLILCGIATVGLILKKLWKREGSLYGWLSIGGTGAVLYLLARHLVVLPSEYIHYPEYAGLYALLFWATRGQVWWSLGLTILAGTLDEAIQAFVPRRVMDINDILLNIAGGLIGVILVWLLRPGESGQHES